MTAASSSRRARSSGPWCGRSTRRPARRSTTRVAGPAASSPWPSHTRPAAPAPPPRRAPPHIWHGNTLTGQETYGGLFLGAPSLFDVILMNPPFGGKEGKEAQTLFAYKTGATQGLFLQHVIGALKPGGRCGMVIDEGVLFRTTETAFVQTKRKLLDDCDLWCIVSRPPGAFSAAAAGG